MQTRKIQAILLIRTSESERTALLIRTSESERTAPAKEIPAFFNHNRPTDQGVLKLKVKSKEENGSM